MQCLISFFLQKDLRSSDEAFAALLQRIREKNVAMMTDVENKRPRSELWVL